MSLINDMLRDLDRRGQRRPESDSSGAVGSDNGAMHSALGQPERRVWWPAALAFVVVMLLAWFGWSRLLAGDGDPGPSEPVADNIERDEPEVSAPQFQEQAELERELMPTPAASGEPGSSLSAQEPSSAKEPSSERGAPAEFGQREQTEAKISALLASAERARQRDRLTRPADDNAYDYYQQVLALEPGQAQATAGLVAIARRYLELAEAAMDDDDLGRARRFVQRARSVHSGVSGLDASIERLQNLSAAREDATTEPKASSSGPQRETESAVNAGDDSSIDVRLDLRSRDRRAARRARQLWQSGDQAGARAELEQSLAALTDEVQAQSDPESTGPVETASLLVELYLEAGEVDRARALVTGPDYWPAVERARQLAGIAVHQGEPERAIEYLESELDSAADDQHYRAQLARLYYAQGQHARAVESYQALLSDFGQRPAYWLGLGLARDARDEPELALTALRRAQQSGAYGRDSSVGQYLERRIAALSRQINAQEP